ncbi:MAG TPA: sigma-70 family RNA polymerase sigma factor [Acidimicrobiales bacterium]
MTVEIVHGESCSTDAQTFAELYEQWYPRTVDLCKSTGCGDDDPEDVAQEAFLKAWAAWDGYRSTHPFWPWLATIAARSCVDHWRRAVRTATRDERIYATGHAPVTQPDEIAEECAEWEIVSVAYAGLKAAERRMLGLRDIEGWTYNEIAEFENVTVDSVRATLHRARAALRFAYRKAIEGAPILVVVDLGRRLSARLALGSARARRVAGADPTFAERIHAATAGAAALALVMVAPGAGTPDAPSLVGRGDSRPDHVAAADPGHPSGAPEPGAPVPAAGGGLAVAPSAALPGDAAAPVSAPRVDESPLSPRPPFDPATSPEAGMIQSFVVMPDDPDTVYAVGKASKGCSQPECPAVYRTTDGGRSWRRLGGTGFTGGTLLVPQGDPTGRRLFAVGVAGLQASLDGGATFDVVAPIKDGEAAISPAFSAGDPRILLGGATGWEYRHSDDAAARSLVPARWMTGASLARGFAFSPAYPQDPRVLVSALARESGASTSTVTVCRAVCGAPAALEGLATLPKLTVSPAFATTGAAVAWTELTLHGSTDGGSTFAPIGRPPKGGIKAVTFGQDGALVAATHELGDRARNEGGLYVSRDMGATWTAVGDATFDGGVLAIASPRPGHLIAAPAEERGVMCSTDDGRTWARRCD